MPSPARQSEEKKPHQVYWDAEPWERILRAAEVLWKRQTVDQGPVTPTDVIRNGTMRFVDEVLADQPEKAR